MGLAHPVFKDLMRSAQEQNHGHGQVDHPEADQKENAHQQKPSFSKQRMREARTLLCEATGNGRMVP
jgi:hypothetical protein